MKSLNIILFIGTLITSIAKAQTGNIEGTIKNSKGEKVAYADVALEGMSFGVISGSDGNFKISNVPAGNYTIVVSIIGYETTRQKINVAEGKTVAADFSINGNSRQLKQVEITDTKTSNERPVSIGKIPIKPMDMPQSVSVIGKEVMEQQQTLRMSDALKNVNGVYQMGATGGYQEEIAGRGFAFGNSNTFKNGVRFNNTAMPEMSSLESMEVMKGSTAILFGNVAPGGVINLITKKPLFEKGGEVSMRVGSYDFYKPYMDVYGSLNKKNTVAYRLNTSFEKARSFRDDVKGERYYINPSFLVKLGSKTDVVLEGDYLSDERRLDYGVGAIDYTLIDVPRSRYLGVSWAYFKSEQQSSTATITHRFNNNWQIRNVTSYQKFKSDLFGNQRPNGNSQFIKPDGTWIRGLQRSKIDEDYYLTEIDLTGKFSTGSFKHIFLAGADADKYVTDNTAYTAIAKYDSINVFDLNKYKQRHDIPDLAVNTLTTNPVKRSGIYVQDLVSLTEKIKLLAGVRFSYFETFSNVYSPSKNTNVETKQYDHAVTPRFGVVYQPLKTMALFASYSNSFNPNTGVDIEGKALPPSYIDQYEAGIKNDLFKGLLSANVTAYRIVNSNLAQTSLENGNTNTNIKELAGEITSRGIEVDISTRTWKGFSLIAGYSFNETKYTKSNTFVVGSKLRYNPQHTANTSIQYDFSSVKVLKGFNAGISVLYFGDRVAGRSTRVTVPNDSYKLMPLPAFAQLDAGVGYAKNNISLRIKISNIFDVLSYHVHDDNSVNPVPPTMFAATVGYKF